VRKTTDIDPFPQLGPTIFFNKVGDDVLQRNPVQRVFRLCLTHGCDYILLRIQLGIEESSNVCRNLFLNKRTTQMEWFFLAGGDDRIRTGDLGLDRAAC
jgi:hypothetical protein